MLWCLSRCQPIWLWLFLVSGIFFDFCRCVLTGWGRATHMCIDGPCQHWSRVWFFAWSAPNQCWLIIDQTIGNELHWNSKRGFCRLNAFGNWTSVQNGGQFAFLSLCFLASSLTLDNACSLIHCCNKVIIKAIICLWACRIFQWPSYCIWYIQVWRFPFDGGKTMRFYYDNSDVSVKTMVFIK